jgi:acetyl esterase
MPPADPRAPLNPQVKTLLDLFLQMRPEPRILDPVILRQRSAAMAPWLTAGAPEVKSEREIKIPGPAGDIRALVFVPKGVREQPPLVVYLHGGGFVNLSPDTHAKLTKHLAAGTGSIVLSVDYRLAPENPYPAGLEDCLAAFRWARENAASLGADSSRVAIAGDSAGGNLAAATTLRLLDDGDEPPSAAVLLVPWLDLANATPSFRTFGPDDAIIDDIGMNFYRESYAPRPEQWDDPFVSPLRGDLSRFPPTCVVVGGIDPLCDDGILFAGRVQAAGGDAVLLNYPGMPHGFMFFPGINEGAQSLDEVCAFLRKHLATPATTPAR